VHAPAVLTAACTAPRTATLSAVARLAARLAALSAGRSLAATGQARGTPAHGRCRAGRTYAALVPDQPTTGKPSTSEETDDATRPTQRQLQPLDPPAVPFAIGGIVLWLIAGLILLLFRDTLSAHGHTDWLWICLAGALWGLPGWYVMFRHDRRRAAQRASRSDEESSSVG
jgi:Protein of unknown function (DUF2530)